MLTEVRKLHIIEALLKTDDESTLNAVEEIMYLKNGADPKKRDFSEVLGIITEEEAEQMIKVIEENFEQIHDDDWK